jgi:hypothetical protein
MAHLLHWKGGMSSRFAVIALLLALPSSAAELTLIGPVGVRLSDLTIQPLDQGDLRVLPLRIEARYGIRLEQSGQQFASSAPVVIGEPYLVRDQNRAEYRLWVRLIAGSNRWLEIAPTETVQSDFSMSELLYRGVRASADGHTTTAKPRDLRLSSDGTYYMGGARGRWTRDGSSISLEGGYGHWGRGRISEDGETLVFRYIRSRVEFEMVLARDENQAVIASR